MDHVSLVTWPAIVVGVASWAVVVALLARHAAGSPTRSPALAGRVVMWSLTATASVALALHATGIVPLQIPRWFYVVAIVPFVGPALGVAAGPRLGGWSRAVAAACLPLGLVAGGLVVNQHYQYWPTLAAVAGRDHVDPVVEVPVGQPVDAGLRRAAIVAGRHGHDHGGLLDHGVLVDVRIPGVTSGFHARAARIWLPPAFATHPEVARPVVVLIGGTPSWTSDWTRAASIDVVADRVAAAHGGEAPLLVMVDPNGTPFGDTECVDSRRGRSETYLTEDVPAFVVAHFGASPDRSAWGVAGYSMGGTCAAMLALRHPDRFAAFADLAGDARPDVGGPRRTLHDLFAGDEAAFEAHDPAHLLAARPAPAVAAWFGSGRSDGPPRKETERLAADARAAGLTVASGSYDGGHDFGFVHHALGDALPWLTDRLRASQ